MKRYFVPVCGVRSDPEDRAEWPYRVEDWIEGAGVGCATAYVYHTLAVARRCEQGKHVRQVAEILARLTQRGWDVTAIGHSNGCAIILDALRLARESWGPASARLRSVHLVAAAAKDDCEANGLNAALSVGQVGACHLYGSRGDAALKAARWSERVFGWLGLGYGRLGLTGPTRLAPGVADMVRRDWRDDFGHSTWFDANHFGETMGLVTR